MGKVVVWTDEMLDYIREHFADEPSNDIGDALGISDSAVRRKARLLGLKKSSDFKTWKFCGRYTGKNGYERHENS